MQWLNNLLNPLIEFTSSQGWQSVADILITIKDHPMYLLVFFSVGLLFFVGSKMGAAFMKLSIFLAPKTIALIPQDEHYIDEDSSIHQDVIAKLLQLGFSRGLDYSQGKWNTPRIATFFKDDISVAVYSTTNLCWYDMVSLFTDNTRLTLTTDMNAKHYPKLPNQTYLFDDYGYNKVFDNLAIFEKHLSQQNKKQLPLNNANFKEIYERVYAENMVNAKS